MHSPAKIFAMMKKEERRPVKAKLLSKTFENKGIVANKLTGFSKVYCVSFTRSSFLKMMHVFDVGWSTAIFTASLDEFKK